MTITESINASVKSLVDDVKGLPKSFKKVDVADLRSQAQGLAKNAVGQAAGAYAGLTKQGEKLVSKAKGIKVEDVRADAHKAAADVKDKAEELVDDVLEKAEEVVHDVRKTVNKAATKTPAKAPVAPEPAATEPVVTATATKAAVKTAAKKPAAKKPSTTAAAKPAAKKA